MSSQLLQYAANKLSPDDQNKLLEGVQFQVKGEWRSVRDGSLVDDSGNIMHSGTGDVTGVRISSEYKGSSVDPDPVIAPVNRVAPEGARVVEQIGNPDSRRTEVDTGGGVSEKAHVPTSLPNAPGRL